MIIFLISVSMPVLILKNLSERNIVSEKQLPFLLIE